MIIRQSIAPHKICTPRLPFSQERECFYISESDSLKMPRGEEWRATVTCLDTGKKYTLMSAECSLPGCFCDAIIAS